jgi:hypothetical protein
MEIFIISFLFVLKIIFHNDLNSFKNEENLFIGICSILHN